MRVILADVGREETHGRWGAVEPVRVRVGAVDGEPARSLVEGGRCLEWTADTAGKPARGVLGGPPVRAGRAAVRRGGQRGGGSRLRTGIMTVVETKPAQETPGIGRVACPG
ncbi:hypothetical protein GCM10010172_38730 [Paractinoplanes ferrugineus]|uniref:Uncharacterized protein n=1 Tax=Paractinoplanes ferrugineus TaxID=113564 RepID=A0A919MFE2_9ACTN|nr:hypothetical protein Afe05nite_44890 [Actinoplanes ferrugineus]